MPTMEAYAQKISPTMEARAQKISSVRWTGRKPKFRVFRHSVSHCAANVAFPAHSLLSCLLSSLLSCLLSPLLFYIYYSLIMLVVEVAIISVRAVPPSTQQEGYQRWGNPGSWASTISSSSWETINWHEEPGHMTSSGPCINTCKTTNDCRAFRRE
jgi:hypothetical protein